MIVGSILKRVSNAHRLSFLLFRPSSNSSAASENNLRFLIFFISLIYLQMNLKKPKIAKKIINITNLPFFVFYLPFLSPFLPPLSFSLSWSPHPSLLPPSIYPHLHFPVLPLLLPFFLFPLHLFCPGPLQLVQVSFSFQILICFFPLLQFIRCKPLRLLKRYHLLFFFSRHFPVNIISTCTLLEKNMYNNDYFT